jgi:Phage integrase family
MTHHPRSAHPSTRDVTHVPRTQERPQPGILQDRLQISRVTHLTEDGVDRRFIQVAVGHECDSSTAIYTHVSSDFMNTALRRALAPALDNAPEKGGR